MTGSRRWAVTLDGEVDERFRTRAAARAHAAWLRGHPAVIDRVERSDIGGARVAGVVAVVDADAHGEGCPACGGDTDTEVRSDGRWECACGYVEPSEEGQCR